MKSYNGEKAIISLTSWKARINTVHKTIANLIGMCPGFHVVLVLSEEEFPKKEEELPASLMNFVNNDLIELLWVYKNYKSFKKILFTMDKYKDVPVISADDDCIYKINYAEELYQEWLKHKDNFITFWMKPQFNTYHLAGCYTLYPPNIFKNYALNLLKKYNFQNLTLQDDNFYTYMRKLLNINKCIKINNNRNTSDLLCFHDTIKPCKKELMEKTHEKIWKLFETINLQNDLT